MNYLNFAGFWQYYHERIEVFTKLLHGTNKRNLRKVPRNVQSYKMGGKVQKPKTTCLQVFLMVTEHAGCIGIVLNKRIE